MTFEDVYQLALRLPVPSRERQRTVEWCGDGRVVALARHRDGGFEVFVRCPPLRPASALVQRHIQHDRWEAADHTQFEANRIVLPAEPHFAAVAAFLVEELLRNAADRNPVRAFTAAEPLVEMALRRATLEDELVLGLLGELRFLQLTLQSAASAAERAAGVESWRGYDHASRDFVFGTTLAVEVKVTRSLHSVHHISSIAQVDPKRSSAGRPLEQLFLVSFGVCEPQAEPGEVGVSLSQQVDEVLHLLGPSTTPQSRNELQELFLTRVQRYGAGQRRGYVHDEMSTWGVYRAPWVLRFERAYDMNSESVHVLRLADLARRQFVPAETVKFEVNLPDVVDGTRNPRVDLARLAGECLGQSPG